MTRYGAAEPPLGEHRIYLSLAPGIGATRRLLSDAQHYRTEGFRVLMGFRALTSDLREFARGFEVAPMRQEQVRGATVEALDLQAVIRAAPDIVILGNLAYQTGLPSTPIAPLDLVEALRAAGIAVWSTVYAYNLTTIAPIYQRQSNQGIDVLIPEYVLDQANDLVLIDPEPEEIMRQFEAGILVPPGQATIARQTIFRPDILTQLRAATHALLEIHRPVGTITQRPLWMVCIGYNPNTIYLLQRAADLAHGMGALLIGLHVRPPGGGSSGYELTMREHLEYAEELCYEVVVIEDKDVGNAMITVINEYEISGIFLGRPIVSRWDELRGNSLVTRLINHDRSIDLFVLADAPTISH